LRLPSKCYLTTKTNCQGSKHLTFCTGNLRQQTTHRRTNRLNWKQIAYRQNNRPDWYSKPQANATNEACGQSESGVLNINPVRRSTDGYMASWRRLNRFGLETVIVAADRIKGILGNTELFCFFFAS